MFVFCLLRRCWRTVNPVFCKLAFSKFRTHNFFRRVHYIFSPLSIHDSRYRVHWILLTIVNHTWYNQTTEGPNPYRQRAIETLFSAQSQLMVARSNYVERLVLSTKTHFPKEATPLHFNTQTIVVIYQKSKELVQVNLLKHCIQNRRVWSEYFSTGAEWRSYAVRIFAQLLAVEWSQRRDGDGERSSDESLSCVVIGKKFKCERNKSIRASVAPFGCPVKLPIYWVVVNITIFTKNTTKSARYSNDKRPHHEPLYVINDSSLWHHTRIVTSWS